MTAAAFYPWRPDKVSATATGSAESKIANFPRVFNAPLNGFPLEIDADARSQNGARPYTRWSKKFKDILAV